MRIRGGDEDAAVSAPPPHLVFAYYITGHGFGHATRALEVVRHLIAAGHDVHVVTGAPEFVFTTDIKPPNLHIRKVLLDCGAVQADALTVDRLASLEKYHQTAVVPRESILRTEVEWLNSIKADLAVSDVVPVACRVAADAGIRSVCVTNFSWDFIYAEYVVAAGHHHRSIVWQVSFGSELSNRAPTFDMDLSDFMDGDKPISYDKANEYFYQDPSQKWAAYVAGTILVLMTELGVRFTDSMSILVSSSVPEGKGVSSSASVEVATMSAIAAVYGLNITPRDLAILCQKVENRVVGAPCGVMDQMTSACGEANKLLAMVCQLNFGAACRSERVG